MTSKLVKRLLKITWAIDFLSLNKVNVIQYSPRRLNNEKV